MRRSIVLLLLGLGACQEAATSRDGGDSGVADGALPPRDSAPPGPIRCPLPTGCDVVEQTCGDGMGCYFVEGAAAQCLFAGGAGEGLQCSAVDDCAPGSTCLLDAAGAGRCHRYCCPEAGGCAAGAECARVAGVSFGICTPGRDCTPAPQAGCGDTSACYPVSATGNVACFERGTLTEGAACSSVSDCLPGLGCLSRNEGPSLCIRLCDPVAGAGCPANLRCARLGESRVAVCEPTSG
jgi:hypothetical protein